MCLRVTLNRNLQAVTAVSRWSSVTFCSVLLGGASNSDSAHACDFGGREFLSFNGTCLLRFFLTNIGLDLDLACFYSPHCFSRISSMARRNSSVRPDSKWV
ncbi:uncharacterized protein G2W53_018466 [Senna tora]|uniref:Uncharacterized protein n=1 Tax=Senna tora TaxID=362788 RepID=A0A834WLD6_9FABA|nr:uncharacterized protein G2W53_018466 [Senna tora]